MTRSLASIAVCGLALSALAGCGSVHCDCDCPRPLRLDIMHSEGVTPTVTGEPSLVCHTELGATTCTAADAEVGSHTYELSAPGHASMSVTLTAERDGVSGGCCDCAWRDRRETVRLPGVGPTPPDAGVGDAGLGDAGVADAGVADAGVADATTAACRPERVSFPMGGELAPGTLCDEVFVCVADAAAAARVEEASPRFACAPEPPGFPCAGSTRCAYQSDGGGGPSTLDAQEVADICRVTVLEPAPDGIVCVVYL